MLDDNRRGRDDADAPQVQTGAAAAGETNDDLEEEEDDDDNEGEQEQEQHKEQQKGQQQEGEEGTEVKRRKLNEDAVIDLTDEPGVAQTATRVPVRAAVAQSGGRSSLQAASSAAASGGRRQIAAADRRGADVPAQPLPAQSMPTSSSPARVKVDAAPAVPAPAPLPIVNGPQAAAPDGLKMTLSEAVNMLVLEAARRLGGCEEGSEQTVGLERLLELLLQVKM